MKVLVVGLGAIARRHIRNLKTLDSSIEIACWRQRTDPAGWQPPKDLPVDRYIYDASLVWTWQPDAAIIANPTSMHVETAATIALSTAHLFVEKPLSDSLKWVDWLIGDRARKGLVLMVGYDLRFYQPLIAVKEAIDSGRIGRPLSIRCEVGQYLPDWRSGRDYRTSVSARAALGGGVLLELSHEIDYARWLMGEVASVSAMTGRLSDLEIDVEDTADILLRFASGAQGSIHMDMTDRSLVRGCRVVGTEGSLVCGMPTNSAMLWRSGSWDVLTDGQVMDDALMLEMRHFLACCRGEAVPPVDGETARRVLEIALAAKRSAEEKREVEV